MNKFDQLHIVIEPELPQKPSSRALIRSMLGSLQHCHDAKTDIWEIRHNGDLNVLFEFDDNGEGLLPSSKLFISGFVMGWLEANGLDTFGAIWNEVEK